MYLKVCTVCWCQWQSQHVLHLMKFSVAFKPEIGEKGSVLVQFVSQLCFPSLERVLRDFWRRIAGQSQLQRHLKGKCQKYYDGTSLNCTIFLLNGVTYGLCTAVRCQTFLSECMIHFTFIGPWNFNRLFAIQAVPDKRTVVTLQLVK